MATARTYEATQRWHCYGYSLALAYEPSKPARCADLELDDGTWVANAVGKGGGEFRQEITDAGAVVALQKVYKRQHGKAPNMRSEDSVLWSLPTGTAAPLRPLSYNSLL